jgi:plastocyanin
MRNVLLSAAVLMSVFTAGAVASDVPIDQAGQKFAPDSVSVKVGDTLIFTNKDDVKHNINVISPSGDAEDKGVQAPGENIKQTFTSAGEYQVRCKIHPKMKMTVIVQ